MSAELIERLRSLSELEPGWYANVGRRTGEACCKAMREAADALASKEEEIKALKLFVEQCDALFEALQNDASFALPKECGRLATYRAVAHSLRGDADVSRGGGDG